MTPPPAATPKPPEPDRHDTAEMPVTKGEMRRSFRINEVFTFVVAALTAIGAVFGAYRLLLSEAEAAGEKGAARAEQRIVTLEQQRRQDRDDMHELQKDIRELYRVMPRVRDSARLEKPLGDGGSP